MIPVNIGRKKPLAAIAVDEAGDAVEPSEESPTGLAFTCIVMDEGLTALRKLLFTCCIESEIEHEQQEGDIAVGMYDSLRQAKVPGGLSHANLQKLDDWWHKWSPLKHTIRGDIIFQSEVIHPDLFRLSRAYYHKMNFCLLGQIFDREVQVLKEKMWAKAKKHQAKPLLGIG